MRALAFFIAPLALSAAFPAGAQEHNAHRAPPGASAPIGAPQAEPAHAADLYFDPAAMAQARAQLLRDGGGMTASAFYIDQLEATFDDAQEGYAWEAQGWRGGDVHRFWWKSEGEGAFSGDFEYGELQALYSRAVTPYFDAQIGVRQSHRPAGDRTDLVVALQGLAPSMFDVQAEAFLSQKGDATARATAEYDLRLTQRLILQPKAALNFAAKDIPDFTIAAGFTDIELGLRLRYEIRRNFAPYVGFAWSSDLGGTRDLARAAGEDPDALHLVVGLHAFF